MSAPSAYASRRFAVDALATHEGGGLHGRPEVPVWVTEFGSSTCPTGDVVESAVKGCVDEAGQAGELVTTLRDLGRNYPWVPVAMVYEAQDEPDASGGAAERSFGLFEASGNGTNWTEKPAVAAIRELYTRSGEIRRGRN